MSQREGREGPGGRERERTGRGKERWEAEGEEVASSSLLIEVSLGAKR